MIEQYNINQLKPTTGGLNTVFIPMNIQSIEGVTPTSLRKLFPHSRFFYSDFDSFIAAIETETKSIIYDIEEVLIHMLKIENPYSSVGRVYKDFEFLYDTAFEKLVKSDTNIGIDELKDLVEDNIENPSDDNPYSFLWSDEIIQNLNR